MDAYNSIKIMELYKPVVLPDNSVVNSATGALSDILLCAYSVMSCLLVPVVVL